MTLHLVFNKFSARVRIPHPIQGTEACSDPLPTPLSLEMSSSSLALGAELVEQHLCSGQEGQPSLRCL
jgi:hypothetical protein